MFRSLYDEMEKTCALCFFLIDQNMEEELRNISSESNRDESNREELNREESLFENLYAYA